MSFLQGLGGPLAGAAGGAITPLSGLGQVGGPLSGIGILGKLFGGGGGDDGAAPSAPAATPAVAAPPVAASGLGHLLGVDPGRVSDIAGSIGKGMNQIAAAGGAGQSYPDPGLPAVNNHMQLLDPNILRALIQHFSGQR